MEYIVFKQCWHGFAIDNLSPLLFVLKIIKFIGVFFSDFFIFLTQSTSAWILSLFEGDAQLNKLYWLYPKE